MENSIFCAVLGQNGERWHSASPLRYALNIFNTTPSFGYHLFDTLTRMLYNNNFFGKEMK